MTVLVGTNDVNATLSPKNSRLYQRQKKLPLMPSPSLYHENLNAIVRKLAEQTHSKVALLSLSVIGEVLDSTPVTRTGEYSAIVRDVATLNGVNFLPLYERMTDYLRTNNISPGTLYRPGNFLPSTASMQYFLLRRDLDTISARRGLHLTTDTIRLNSRGASMVADLIEEFVLGQMI